MKRFNEYADDATSFASPYFKKTEKMFVDAKEAIEDKYYREKKKRIRKRRIVKIKNFLDRSIGLFVIILTVVAIVMKLMSYSKTQNHSCCKSKNTKKCNSGHKPNVDNKKQKPDSGYITL